MRKLTTAFAAAVLSCGAAYAQTGTPPAGRSPSPSTSSSTPSTQGANVQARVRKNLADAGFTDIHIVPEGFIVQAKDKDGTPVTMLINPNSVSEIIGPDQMNAGTNSAPKSSQSTAGQAGSQ